MKNIFILKKINFIIIFLFGSISGFTVMITGNTLNYWLSKVEIGLESIGVFSFILIPYSINFLWAPLFDTIKLDILNKFLGHRLSWFFLINIILCIFILFISFITPNNNLLFFAVLAFCISFFSSAQDTILGALRTEITPQNKHGLVSGIYILGYRIGMLLSGSGAIYLSSLISWNLIYKIFSTVLFVFSILLIFFLLKFTNYRNYSYRYKKNDSFYRYNSIKFFFLSLLKTIGSIYFIIQIIIFLILYRLPDNCINVMINPFLLHIGYNELEIASAGKLFGIISAIIGGLFASFIMRKKTIWESLLIFGLVHGLSHIFFIIQELLGKDMKLLFLTIGFEALTGGMTMAAYIALISSICKGRFRATQYSFFTAMMGFSRAIFPATSGYFVINFGWIKFFIFIIIITIPSLILLFKMKKKIYFLR